MQPTAGLERHACWESGSLQEGQRRHGDARDCRYMGRWTTHPEGRETSQRTRMRRRQQDAPHHTPSDRIGADPGARSLRTVRCLRAVRVFGRIASAADPLVRRSVVEIAIEKPRSLAVVEWLHIFLPVFPGVPRPLRSDDVRSSCTWPNCDERSRGVIAALLSWSTIRGRDRSHTKTRARMISLRCSSGVLPPCSGLPQDPWTPILILPDPRGRLECLGADVAE